MQPTQPSYIPEPPVSNTQPHALNHAQHTNKLKLIWGLVCLIAPTGIILLSIVIYAVVNFVSASSGSGYEASSGRTFINIIMFGLNAIAFITWLPGIIVGIILLATRKQI
jgi:hypothetical protein